MEENKFQPTEISISSFFEEYGEALNRMIVDKMNPVYDKSNFDSWEDKSYRKIHKHLRASSFKEIDAQVNAILALSKGFYKEGLKSLFMVGEMGTGKTFIGAMVSYMMPQTDKRIVVMCPSHLVAKWQKECQRVMPEASVKILQSVGDVSLEKPKGTEVWVLSKETAKLHYTGGFFSNTPNDLFRQWFDTANSDREPLSSADEGFRGWATSITALAYELRMPLKIKGYKVAISDDGQVTVSIAQAPEDKFRGRSDKRTENKYLAYARLKKDIHSFSDFLQHHTKDECPICGKKLRFDGGFEDNEFCGECGSPQITFDRSGIRRYAIAEYIKRKKPHIDLCIMDEVHELKGGTSAQGQAMANICNLSKYRLAMTGTLMGGYSTNLYHLLFRLFTKDFIRQGYSHDSAVAFSEKYGVIEVTELYEEIKWGTSSNNSRHICSIGKKVDEFRKEKPGISPALIPDFLLGYTYFLKLEELSDELPPYEEHLHLIPMCTEQRSVYDNFVRQIRNEAGKLVANGQKQKLAVAVGALYALPDRIRHKNTASDIASVDSVEVDILPKEEALLALVEEAKKNNRKVWVFAENTDKKDILKETALCLNRHGYTTEILRSNTVMAKNREKWIQKKLEMTDPDVIFSNPSLVKTGLDLYEFPELVFYQTGYNIYTLRQASRRSWRLGQNRDVNVHFFCYENSAQEDAMKLIADKLVTSLSVEGDLSETGLSDMASSANSIVSDLARTLITGSHDKNTIDSFASYRKKDAIKHIDIKTVENPFDRIRRELIIEADTEIEASIVRETVYFDSDPVQKLMEKGVEPVSMVLKGKEKKEEITVTFFSIDQLLTA